MKKYSNLKEFLADLVKYGKLWDEQGNYIEITETEIDCTVCYTWKQICNVTWSLTEPLKDKDLIWCWDNHNTHQRVLRFWDGKHNTCFQLDGARNDSIWGNYEKFTGEWPEWAKEAVKTLED